MMEAPSAPTDLSRFLSSARPAVQSILEDLLPDESVAPSIIHQAMRYSTLGGGKQIRPCLCLAGYLARLDDWTPVLPVAAAIEMIHSYSLIHDDLPAMDDDDERRGRPSCHKKFGEAIAILAGDALLTLAFETLARTDTFPPDRMLQVISVLAGVAGTRDGMIAGQVLDIQAEGKTVAYPELESIHRSKTGALIGGAVWIGAYLAELSDIELARMSKYGEAFGLAFQILDDIDEEIEATGRDRGKATYPSIYGIDRSRTMARDLLGNARRAVAPLGERSRILVEFCDLLENR
jgi:geranylgeranyl diphosphate synthase type II